MQRRTAHGWTAAQVGRTLAGGRIQEIVLEAAAADAQRLMCRPSGGGRAGRGGHGGGHGCGRRGRGGGDERDLWRELEAIRLAAARRLQHAMGKMLAQRQEAAAATSTRVARTAQVAWRRCRRWQRERWHGPSEMRWQRQRSAFETGPRRRVFSCDSTAGDGTAAGRGRESSQGKPITATHKQVWLQLAGRAKHYAYSCMYG